MTRRLLISLLVLFALIGGVASFAHAQTDDDFNFESTAFDEEDQIQGQAMSSAAAGVTASKATTPLGPEKPPGGEAYAEVMQWIMKLFAWLLGVAVITLDNAAYYTVVTMGSYVSELSAVGVSWGILRDIGNIMLIFGFIAAGLFTILNLNFYGFGKTMLPKLLMAAVFLNFSLFISEAVIDAGNLFATQFYTQINGGAPPAPVDFSLTAIRNEGISNKVMAQLGLQNIYSSALTNTKIFEAGNSWLIGFLGIILFIVAAFVFFTLAFILIARFVILLFLIIVAPIGFAGWAIPKLSGLSTQYWSELTKQTITAPVLLLLLYVALAIITDEKFLSGFGASQASNTGAWSGLVGTMTDPSGFAGMLLSFLVAMGLLLAVAMAAKKLSAFGASGAMKLAGGATFGLTAWGLRSTAGWGSQRLSELARRSRIARVPILGRAVLGGLDRGAKGSFDIRGTKALGLAKVDAGKAQKGGYRDWEKERIKEREDHAKSLKQTSGEEAQQKVEEARKKQMDQTVQDIEAQNRRDEEDLRRRHRNEMSDIQNELQEARRKVTRTQSAANANPGDPATQAALAQAQNDLNAVNARRNQDSDRQQQEMDALRRDQRRALDAQKLEAEERQKEVDRLRTAPQAGYAKGIVWGPGVIFKRNRTASENILKEAKKKKSEKDIEVLRKALEQSESPTAPPPPPAPPNPPAP